MPKYEGFLKRVDSGGSLPQGVNKSDIKQPEMTSRSDDDMQLKQLFAEAVFEGGQKLLARMKEIESADKQSDRSKDDDTSGMMSLIKKELSDTKDKGKGFSANQVAGMGMAVSAIGGLVDPTKSTLRTALDVGAQAAYTGAYITSSYAMDKTNPMMDPVRKDTIAKEFAEAMKSVFQGLTKETSSIESYTTSNLTGSIQRMKEAGVWDQMSERQKQEYANMVAARGKRAFDASTEAAKYSSAATMNLVGTNMAEQQELFNAGLDERYRVSREKRLLQEKTNEVKNQGN